MKNRDRKRAKPLSTFQGERKPTQPFSFTDRNYRLKDPLCTVRSNNEPELKTATGLKITSSTSYSSPGGGSINTQGMPAGTITKSFRDHQEYFVPYSLPPPIEEGSLVPISEIDPWARVAFQGIERLNRMQSKIFPKAYHSNCNLLVCAPLS